ncbi:MAG: helix-turn-helix domain-containing protein [Planctomycetes bacterium]|nr:helix-turn-helix domain-containing protein [Planctomycetota bacterium]
MRVEPLLRTLGGRIRALRDEHGWSRRVLAQRTSLSERFLAQIETGEANPSVASLLQIARALDTSASELLAAPPRSRAVALLGLRGAGKSSVGVELAKKLRQPFIELDQRIEESAGLALQEIFILHGEDYYRELERREVEKLFPREDSVVIAASGGIVTNRETFDLLRAHATTIWLRADPGDHWSRVVEQGDHRPMQNDPLAMDRLRALLAERAPLYARADATIDTSGKSVAAVVAEIAAWLKKKR